MSKDSVFETIAWTTNAIITLASLVFFLNFARAQNKTYASYMVLILNISDMTFPVMSILMALFNNSTSLNEFNSAFGPSTYRFSLYWSTAIAYFVFLVVKKKILFNPKRFIIYALVLCLILSSLFCIMILFHFFGIQTIYRPGGSISILYPLEGLTNQLLFFTSFDLVGTLLPIFITYHFYLQVYKCLRTQEEYSAEKLEENPKRVLWYSYIQLFCFVPGTLSDAIFMFQGRTAPFTVSVFISVTRRSWGFLNLLAYWFLKITKRKEEEQSFAVNDNSDIEKSFSMNESI